MSIRLIIAGGSIDKAYDELTGDLAFGDTQLNKMLEQARFKGQLAVEHLLMKHSYDMTEDDYQKLAEACVDAKEDRIVVTHGTITMIKSAEIVEKALEENSKTVVFTGARIPYSLGQTSDALFNLGTALAFVRRCRRVYMWL
jgi:L-asparaginase